MEKLKIAGTFTLSLSLVYLAFNLGKFTLELQTTRTTLPSLLDKLQTVEKGIEVQKWLNLITKIDNRIPQLVTEVSETRQTLAKIQSDIPSFISESKNWRENSIPSLLEEAQKTRQLIPPSLNHAEKIVKEAKSIAGTASEDVVGGAVKGIITAPFDLIEDAADAVTGGRVKKKNK